MIDDVHNSQVSELPMVLRAMIDFDQTGGGGVALMNPVDQFSSRFRSRLHPKGGMLQPPSPNPSEYISSSSPRSTYGIGELNRRITDLKVDHPALSPPHNFMRDSSPKLLDLGQNYPNNGNTAHYQQTTLQFNQQLNQQIRRDSNNSTTSSSYYSMKSCDVSRRSSNQSHTSSISTLRPSSNASLATAAGPGGIIGANNFNGNNNYDSNLFYDPISAGSSRRSSQLSTADGIGNNNYGPPSSQLLSSHLARLQRHSNAPSHQYNSAASFYQHSHPYNSYNYPASSQGVGNMNNSMFYNYPTHPNGHNFPHMYANNNTRQHHQIPSSSTDRRMSEPISSIASRNVQNDFTCPIVQRPRSTTPTKSLEMVLDSPKDMKSTPTATPEKKNVEKESNSNGSSKGNKNNNNKSNNKDSPSKPHPNETVVLDVLKTNEKIENCDELVIPDDMVLYLNQVSDEATTPSTAPTKPSSVPKIKLDLDEIEPMSSSISIEKIKEEDLLTLLAEVDAKSNVNEEQCDMSNNADGSDRQTFNEATVNDFEINNNSQDECKVDSDTKTTRKEITCKS